MVLLFATLVLKGAVPETLKSTATGLLSHLSLLFVPAGVGVMLHFHRVASEWLPIAVALIVSTVLTLAVTALVMRRLLARDDRRRADGGGP
jgi:holin-like protein